MATSQQPPDIDVQWDLERPAEMEARFRAILARADDATAPAPLSLERPYRAELLTQIARTEGLQRRFADAQRTLDQADTLLTDADRRARVRYLLERGRVHNSAGEAPASRPLFLAAWELALAAGEDFHAVDAAHMLGIAGVEEERILWHERALALAERSTDLLARGWRSSLLNNLGWIYHDAGDTEQALVLFQQALALREEEGQAREIRIARWAVARALRSLGQTNEALARQQELLRQGEAAADPVPYVHEELAECLLALDRMDEAQPHFVRAYALLSVDPWFAANEPARLNRLRRLGEAGA
jgi:tetratricopeptide (TPR) repeat protein